MQDPCRNCGAGFPGWAPVPTLDDVVGTWATGSIPVGEAVEVPVEVIVQGGDAIPVGEAVEVPVDFIDLDALFADPDATKPIPVGEATELRLPSQVEAIVEAASAIGASWETGGNPKDAVGSTKLPLNLVPDTLAIYAAMAFAEGAAKYGAYNWRASGVRASIYVAALLRHLKKYWNGEEADPKTKVPHLASVIACAAIILDAKLVGKLIDDRPPAADMGRLIEECEAVVLHVATLFADKAPHHWTIRDKVPA